MTLLTAALTTFRRRGLTPAVEPLPAVFVLEPEMAASAAVIASWHPVSALQVRGATHGADLGAARSTLEHAIDRLGARTVVVCAEGTDRPDGRAGERLLGACVALADDPVLGPLLRDRSVAVEALWFDPSEGDIQAWSHDLRSFELLADAGLARFLATVRSRAT